MNSRRGKGASLWKLFNCNAGPFERRGRPFGNIKDVSDIDVSARPGQPGELVIDLLWFAEVFVCFGEGDGLVSCNNTLPHSGNSAVIRV